MSRRAAAASAAVLLSLTLAGCGTSDDEAGTSGDVEAIETASPETSQICEASSYSEPCTFGQTAIYSDTIDGEEMRLEITVLEPVEFTPSAEASFFDNLATEQPALPVNVYFPITITNASPMLTRESSFVFSQATNVSEGEYDTLSVSDGEISGILKFDPLAPGQSVAIKNGWSMSTLDGVEFEVDIDGLQGYSITFTG